MASDAQVVAALGRVTSGLPGGGEGRPGQVEMALAVSNSIRQRRHLVVQAGTGTGKSLGYLVPAILSGTNLVVATATKALQDQLARRDLPLLADRLGRPVRFAVLKGRSNYLCRQRLSEITAGGQEELDADGVGAIGRQVRRLVLWAASTTTGDRAELDFEPHPQAWSAVSVGAMECPGAARCPSGGVCLAEKARAEAADADVVVVNTHLYGAHLAAGGVILPDHDLVVFDEAHELEDVAAVSLGLDVGPGRFRAIGRACRSVKDAEAEGDALVDAGRRLEEALAEAGAGNRLPVGLGEAVGPAVALGASRVAEVIAALRGADDPAAVRGLQAAGHLAADLSAVVDLGDDQVAWVEGRPGSLTLRTASVDVGPRLAEALWSTVTGVLTSATLPPGVGRRVGLPEGRFDQLDVGSPFPYGDAAVLYCAAHLPDPRRPGYEQAVHEELEALIRAAGGRTLALFSSWRAMHAAADAVGPRLPWRVLTQAELPKPALIEAFTGDETSCLFATLGFFQGVDVPGRALSLVTIDRIPFPRPDDPLARARRDRAGPNAFREVDLPRAATFLAQGAGRLIRSAADRGAVAVLDPRLATASYRWDLVRALPPMRRTRHRAEVEAFLATVTGSAPADQ
ncbi:MAG TPA: ATP-dependent DNA helicase [Acidimicrobiales bacterium]|nr:ATP-dependent DNA helicase [Acidimicrobiales bacterium]